MPKYLWPYAVLAVVYIRNRCYNHRLKKTPFEVFTGQKPNLKNMHIFGTTCYMYVEQKKKLDDRAVKGLFLGYDKGSPAYLIYFPENGTIRKSRNVRFTDKFEPKQNCIVDCETDTPQTNHVSSENSGGQSTGEGSSKNQSEQISEPRYPTRERTKPEYFEEYQNDKLNSTVDFFYKVLDVPESYSEAVSSTDRSKWQKAMEEEMQALKENDTFDLTITPKDRTVVGGRWVYAIKPGPNNEKKYKARFVAKGYSQIPGLDYDETFSPTAKMSSIRILMQLAVEHKLIVHQMDVKTAYLNAPIDCELFVEQPEGFTVESEDGQPLVCKLKKSLYGLKQSGRNWNNVLHSYLMSKGFNQSQVDTCVYTRIGDDMSVVILIIFVDDIIIASSSVEVLSKVKEDLGRTFKMKDLGVLSYFLGIVFSCEGHSIQMNQSKYIEKILLRFGMKDCKPRSTPCEMDAGKIMNDDSEPVDGRLYREIVGSLVYVMTATRPDLCFIVTKLSQYLAKPNASHMNVAKHVLRYLKGTIDRGLTFRQATEPLNLVGFCDADWGSSEDRRSITGYCFMLSNNGPLISWKCRKQPTVALSTCEAEYMSLCGATQEAKFLSQLLQSINVHVNNSESSFDTVTLHCDNQGAIALSKNISCTL